MGRSDFKISMGRFKATAPKTSFGGGSNSINRLAEAIARQTHQSQLNIEAEQRKLGNKPAEEIMGVLGKEEEQKRQQFFNFEKVRNLFKSTIGQQKARFEEQKKIPIPSFGQKSLETGGVLKGKVGSLLASARVPGFERTGTTTGQKIETTLALNSILTGQNRVIEGITEKIATTLPDDIETEEFMNEKVAQSIRNAFRLSKSLQGAGFTPDVFASISDEEASDTSSRINQVIRSLPFSELDLDEEEYVQNVINDVLSTPPVKLQSEIRQSPIPGSPGFQGGQLDRKEQLKQRIKAKYGSAR